MKRALIVIALAASALCAFALPKVAVLNPTLDKGIDESVGSPVVDKILEELLRSRKFSIVDRASRDMIWEERNFQITSGEIRSSDIREVGKGLGAEYVVIVKVNRVGSLLSMSTTMINVETLEVVGQASSEAKDSVENLLQLATYCGEELVFNFDGVASSEPGPTEPISDGTDVVADPGTLSQTDIFQVKSDVRVMLKKKMFQNAAGQKTILLKVGGLPLPDKNGLYREFKKEPAGAILGLIGNMVPIIKLGSLLQGDFSGFFLWGGLESLGIVLVSAGIEIGSNDTIGTGAAVWAISYLASFFQPGIFVGNWNKNLAKSLGTKVTYGGSGDGPKLAVLPASSVGGSGIKLPLVSFRY